MAELLTEIRSDYYVEKYVITVNCRELTGYARNDVSLDGAKEGVFYFCPDDDSIYPFYSADELRAMQKIGANLVAINKTANKQL